MKMVQSMLDLACSHVMQRVSNISAVVSSADVQKLIHVSPANDCAIWTAIIAAKRPIASHMREALTGVLDGTSLMSENALESPCVSRNVSPASSSSTSPAASTMSPILVRRRLPRRCTPIMAALYFVRKRDSRTEQPMRGLPMATTTCTRRRSRSAMPAFLTCSLSKCSRPGVPKRKVRPSTSPENHKTSPSCSIVIDATAWIVCPSAVSS
mmetsp:Transcript_31488/g.93904  ORF Transcript_31488/g.93904 Transcript_31488/m.93904 type:complete len:211 (+) Transcript_31488:2315-2947(+)